MNTHEAAGSRQGFGIEHTSSASLSSTDAFFLPLFSLIGYAEIPQCVLNLDVHLISQQTQRFMHV
jgi:hypothetical protein